MELDHNKEYTLNTDGGSRGNPGPSAIGVVISDGDAILFKHHEKVGNGTNNNAEYLALYKGLEICLSLKIRRVLVKIDSELVVKQIRREYKIKDANLQVLAQKIFELNSKFDSFKIMHIPRNLNKVADQLVNYALDH